MPTNGIAQAAYCVWGLKRGKNHEKYYSESIAIGRDKLKVWVDG